MTIMSCEFESHFLHEEKIFAEIAQLVEHNLAKVRVASSSLVFRSEKKEAESFDSASFFLFTVYRCFKITNTLQVSRPVFFLSCRAFFLWNRYGRYVHTEAILKPLWKL